ncbi:MAG: DUF5060 domain-containing protein [candidate division KSB1 bacterium]|nr:DUF5060 domain-containing protein [candidate division KSB1 bacterium]
MKMVKVTLSILCVLILAGSVQAATVTGKLCTWHLLELHFQGANAHEMDDDPNPFLDYRLQVTFTSPIGECYNVPGFFNGDGKGGGNGNIWTVRFIPDQSGRWTYVASFRKGMNIAVNLNPQAGDAAAFDGESGSFTVLPKDPDAPGFLKYGRLE